MKPWIKFGLPLLLLLLVVVFLGRQMKVKVLVAPAVTGTAVGLVSVIGYTPDVYIAAVAGFLIDQSPGLTGFQHLFMLLLGFSVVGAIAAIAFERQARAASVTTGVSSP